MKRSCVMRCPADEVAFEWTPPKHGDQRTDQQHRDETHSDMRRHLEGAQFEQADAQPETFRRIKFVDTKLGAMRVSG